MPNLYELMSDYASLQAAFDDESITMEGLEELLDAVDESKDDLRTKVDNICRLIRNVDGEVDKFRSEERRLAAIRKARENKRQRIFDWLKNTMDLLNVDKVKTNVFEVAMVEQGYKVVVVDEDKIPDEYIRVKKSPNMTKLNKAYKDDGEIVSGCDIVMKKALRIR